MTDEIDYVVDDPVATITLRRAATLNALTYPMLGAFREAVDAAAADPKVVGTVQYAALDRVDATEGAASLIEKRPPVFPRLGDTATRGGAR